MTTQTTQSQTLVHIVEGTAVKTRAVDKATVFSSFLGIATTRVATLFLRNTLNIFLVLYGFTVFTAAMESFVMVRRQKTYEEKSLWLERVL